MTVIRLEPLTLPAVAVGVPLTTIERPEYWLLEAQYPNERGEVLEKHA